MYNNFYYGHYGSFGFDPLRSIGFSLLGIFVFAFVVAILVLKGCALWTAAKRGEKWWFAAILVFNTMGLLELIYLIFVAKVWFHKRHHKAVSEEKKDHVTEDRVL